MLKNKHIVITGATSGIGRALAIALNKQGMKISCTGRSEDKMESLLGELNTGESRINGKCFNITKYHALEFFIKESIKQFGEIDYLINCAGVNSARGNIEDIEVEDLEWMLQVNLIAPFVAMKEVYNQSMKPNKKGMIINVMSTVCLFSNTGIGAYTASKTGFDGLTKVFRKEARANNVKVCAIYPGGVDTPFRATEKPEYLNTNAIVQAVFTMLNQENNSCIDELVIRPMVESNYV